MQPTVMIETPTQAQPAPSLGFCGAILLMIGCFAIAIVPVALVIVFTVATKTHADSWVPRFAAGVLAVLGPLLLVRGKLRELQIPFRSLFAAGALAWVRLPWVAVGVGGHLMVVIASYRFIALHWPWFAAQLRAIKFPFEGPAWAAGAIVMVLIPIVEEVLFRGVILQGMLRRYRPRTALAAGAAVFALSHLEPVQLPVMFLVGIGLGWLYCQTRSLWLPMAAHAMNNGVAVIAHSLRAPEQFPLPTWLAVALVLSGAGLLWAAYRGLARIENRPVAPLAEPR